MNEEENAMDPDTRRREIEELEADYRRTTGRSSRQTEAEYRRQRDANSGTCPQGHSLNRHGAQYCAQCGTPMTPAVSAATQARRAAMNGQAERLVGGLRGRHAWPGY
jgi:hypothetical protein